MASPGQPFAWDELPDEILLQILSDLSPKHIANLQAVSRRLRRFCFDNELWKRASFEKSSWLRLLESRREFHRTINGSAGSFPGASSGHTEVFDHTAAVTRLEEEEEPLPTPTLSRHRDAQFLANWDPTFPNERVSWYDEYIQRNASMSANWLQIPRIKDRGMEAFIEARGMALFNPYDGSDGLGTMMAVSPLEDGSVCLWDVKGTRGRLGGIVAKSRPDILFIDGPGGQNTRRSKKIDTGVTECVSVDHSRHRAFFAVQSHLIEVDLNRLDVVSRESFEWSITTLSQVHDDVPLTVGTTLGVHLHDFRSRPMIRRDVVETVEELPRWKDSDVFKSIFDPKPLPPYASLSQPTPVSILHLPRPGSQNLVSDDIYIAGRFSNILHYDRRKFPHIVGSVYSGALIKSLTALPYPFSTVDNEVRRQGDLSVDHVNQAKGGEGRTLVAGGGYKQKGSLEIYGLSSGANSAGSALQNSTMKNRQTAASSTILSVINHGSKIVFSDGSGWLRWFERDGLTEIRTHKIGHSGAQEQGGLFSGMPASDDLARKILSTQSRHHYDRPNNDNILFWTGEKLGLVSFTKETLFAPEDFEYMEWTEEQVAGHLYSERMREALQKQASEVKFIRNLGLGTRG